MFTIHMKSAVTFDVPRTLCGRRVNLNTLLVENDIKNKDEVTCGNCIKILKNWIVTKGD